jgi:XTP/dITP diphosphohydrolase
MKLLIATTNKNKVREIEAILNTENNFEIVTLNNLKSYPEIIEDAPSFEGNAIKKASTLATYSNLLTLADDSGIEVMALDGRPGVLSARYGGNKLNDFERSLKLLDELTPFTNREARFTCAIAIATPFGETFTTTGYCYGEIAFKPKGENGFGYDLIFYVPELNKTMAELSNEEKNKLSHRYNALIKAKPILEEFKNG